jgi:transcriptional regulator with XRE-family HTH domain
MTGSQLRAARALLGMSAVDLAAKSKVGLATIRRAEAIDGEVRMIAVTEDALRRALEGAGIEFIEQNGGGEGVRLREPRA